MIPRRPRCLPRKRTWGSDSKLSVCACSIDFPAVQLLSAWTLGRLGHRPLGKLACQFNPLPCARLCLLVRTISVRVALPWCLPFCFVRCSSFRLGPCLSFLLSFEVPSTPDPVGSGRSHPRPPARPPPSPAGQWRLRTAPAVLSRQLVPPLRSTHVCTPRSSSALTCHSAAHTQHTPLQNQ